MVESTPVVDTRDLVAAAESVEPLPHTVARLAALVADPDSDTDEIAEAVSLDVTLTADLLRRANSAALGGRYAMTSVREAAIRLGRSMLLSLALASSVGGRMAKPLPLYGLGAGELWERSVAAAIAADAIRTHAGAPIPPEASTAALLHDFGKLVLARCHGHGAPAALLRAALADGLDLQEAERKVFGLDHARVGGIVAESWGLPLTIVDGIAEHHEVHEGLSAVSAAVGLACTISFEVTCPDPTPEQQRQQADRLLAQLPLLRMLRMDRDAYYGAVDSSQRRFADLADRYRG